MHQWRGPAVHFPSPPLSWLCSLPALPSSRASLSFADDTRHLNRVAGIPDEDATCEQVRYKKQGTGFLNKCLLALEARARPLSDATETAAGCNDQLNRTFSMRWQFERYELELSVQSASS